MRQSRRETDTRGVDIIRANIYVEKQRLFRITLEISSSYIGHVKLSLLNTANFYSLSKKTYKIH